MHPKLGPRAEHRQQESLRIQHSASLRERYRSLSALTVNYSHFDPEGTSRNQEIRYTVNLANARSLFQIDCPNPECVGGDYDLSSALATAVVTRQDSVNGELRCRGWLNRHTIDRIHCNNILRFKLTLDFESASDLPPREAVAGKAS